MSKMGERFCLALIVVFVAAVIFIFPIEFVKNCILVWPPEPFNENNCIEETWHSTIQIIDSFIASII